MTVLCAWCTKLLHEGDPDAPVSHGICPSCAADLMPDAVTVALANGEGSVSVDARVRVGAGDVWNSSRGFRVALPSAGSTGSARGEGTNGVPHVPSRAEHTLDAA